MVLTCAWRGSKNSFIASVADPRDDTFYWLDLPATDMWAYLARTPAVRRIAVDAPHEGGRNPGAAPVAGDVSARGLPPVQDQSQWWCPRVANKATPASLA